MHIESISGDAENTTASRGISRRSVMKVGAAAAWSVPLVQVVAAAPAHATSGTRAELSWAALTGSYSSTDARILNVSASISNTGSFDASSVQVVLTVPVEGATVAAPAGWNVTPSGQDFTFTKATPLGASSTVMLALAFTLPTLVGAAISVTGSAGAGNADFVATSVAVAAAGPSTVALVGPGNIASPTQNFASKVLTVQAAVRNNGPRSISRAIVTVSLSRAADSATVTGAGWSVSPTTAGNSYTLTWDGAVLPGGRTADLTASFAFGSNNNATATLGDPTAISV
jgi:hypothetical protein